MTFTEIQDRIAERLGIPSTATDSRARIGREINDCYKSVTTTIGLEVARRTTVSTNATIGSASVTFSGIEKVINVYYEDGNGNPVVLDEVAPEQLAQGTATSGLPTKYCIHRMGASSVTIKMDVLADDTFAINADGHETASTLSGSQVPAFSESFHDILIFGVLAEEYTKMEKAQFAQSELNKFEKRLSDLRMWVAKSKYRDIQQGGNKRTSGANAGGVDSSIGTASYTQTGLITFDRDPSAPFAVSASSAKVDNLDADKLDGLDSSAFLQGAGTSTDNAIARFDGTAGNDLQNSGVLIDDSNNITGLATVTIPNTGLHLFDTDASHDLIIKPGSNLTADRTLTVTTGDADRTVDIGGNLTVSSATTLSGGTHSGTNTGDVTLSGTPDYITIAGQVITRNQVDLAADVTGDLPYANITAASAASKLLGRGDSGSGDWQEISLGAGLSMSGTTLSAPTTGTPADADYLVKTAHAGLDAERVVTDTSTVTWDWGTAGQAKAQVPDGGISYAKIQDVSAASRLLGRGSAAGSGDVQEISLGTGLSMSATTLSATAKMQQLIFTAMANVPPPSNYATLDTRNNHPVLDFDAATDEDAVFGAVLPSTYAGGGLSVDVYWTATSATTGDVVWNAAIERMTTDLDSDSFAAAQAATSTTNGTSGIITKTTVTFTDGAQMDSLAAGEAFRLKVTRDANNGSDTMTGDAEVHRVVVRET